MPQVFPPDWQEKQRQTTDTQHGHGLDNVTDDAPVQMAGNTINLH